MVLLLMKDLNVNYKVFSNYLFVLINAFSKTSYKTCLLIAIQKKYRSHNLHETVRLLTVNNSNFKRDCPKIE